ncbi:putative hydrolase [Stenotrophomonas phage Mendera]|uniref:Cell wall hydrolase n=3 Tax=Menderavirus TaxID=2843421 RepID=A0A5P8PMN8_9CAUD|nr:endolysin [Stenotrophomonas phage Moby]YP_009851244.1 endolysin [Stenotrophomonas phage Mendera]YP_010667480.1 endolysin [Stenotrophomonas maltophilia phage vB_SmaM_Ps15]QYW02725.1 hypothetical protein CPT_Marzo_207 [Stenotrophomonas phage Marzo]QFR56736.1 putative hydrolase [Stenotrophomonas phage Mendera]QFR57929.1 cell wall hydrolase [Stenotrophomonas phage Moby]UMO77152.1 cell wall hydrolase [Stenotrophomonas maltophilia phage vB_SmaM_Ps15]
MFMNKIILMIGLTFPSVMGVSTPDPLPEMPVAIEEAYSEKDVDCLARNIYFEASGESMTGKLSAGFVAFNRSEAKAFPNTICEVVYQKSRGVCQFSWVCQRKNHVPMLRNPMDHQAWEESKWAAIQILEGSAKDPTHGALFYHTVAVNPVWNRKMTQTALIGTHRFFK